MKFCSLQLILKLCEKIRVKKCVEGKPIIVQSDFSILLETGNNACEQAKVFLNKFAELEKSPEYFYTYKLTTLSLWNALSSGISVTNILEGFSTFSRYEVPQNVVTFIEDVIFRYGQVVLNTSDEFKLLKLEFKDKIIFEEVKRKKDLSNFWVKTDNLTFFIDLENRGVVKQELTKLGYPVEDLAGYVNGEFLPIEVCKVTQSKNAFCLRDYQIEAMEVFYQDGKVTGGHGIIVLPCGSGKTIVGIGIMSRLKTHTLIVSTSNIAVTQWINELLDKTSLTPDLIGKYTGSTKDIRAVTVTTYKMLTHRKSKNEPFKHIELLTNHNWGLIVYDEVHLLPAPVIMATTNIQSKRRLGLTATLVRGDGLEHDVFSLVGPKKIDIPWKDVEARGFIAKAYCYEIRVELSDNKKMEYATASEKNKIRIASENPAKIDIIIDLLEKHKGEQILIIGQYVGQLENVAKQLNTPIITGRVRDAKREKLYNGFKKGKIKCLVVSRVANFAVDLPDASIAIQISGTFGSKQEEAQRLGRILRPKDKSSYFYTIVTKNTKEETFSLNRRTFLVEQGYHYTIM